MTIAIQRPVYYERIDKALEERERLASVLEALLGEAKSTRFNTDVQDLIVALRGNTTTEQFIQEGKTSAWLPLILRATASEDSAQYLKQISSDVAFAQENRIGLWRSLAYPVFIFVCALLLFALLSVTVIPTFESMFREFELKLPKATKGVLFLSHQIRERPVSLCIWIAGVALALWGGKALTLWYLRDLTSSQWIGSLVTGNTQSVKAMGYFTSTLAELLSIDAPLHDAVLIAGRASRSLRIEDASKRLAKDIAGLDKFAPHSPVAHNFPVLLSHALNAGPNGTPCVPLLRQIAKNYFERVQHRFRLGEGIATPLAIIAVGGCIGFVALSLFMPLLSLITSLSG